MNSPSGSFDLLSDGWWYDCGWENTPSSDGDNTFDDDAFSNFAGTFAHLPAGLEVPSSWPNTSSCAALTTPRNQEYDFNQGQQVFFVSDAQADRASQSMLPTINRGQGDAELMRVPRNGAIAVPTPPLDSLCITANDSCTYPRSTVADQLSVAPELLQTLFPVPSLPRKEPPCLYDEDGHPLQKQQPRFEGDLYAALWIRGEGVWRAGWCGFCASWHKLKDSAYWYHLHYSHGIACSSGRPLDPPRKLRWSRWASVLEAFCGTCEEWVPIGKGVKVRTAYWRHAYKCLTKGLARPPGRSPRVPDL